QRGQWIAGALVELLGQQFAEIPAVDLGEPDKIEAVGGLGARLELRQGAAGKSELSRDVLLRETDSFPGLLQPTRQFFLPDSHLDHLLFLGNTDGIILFFMIP